jgi:cell division protein FtsX
MKFHPAALMLLTWISAYVIFIALPFTLEGRVMSLYGYLIQAVFLAVFCAGAMMASRPLPQRRRDPGVTVNFRQADQVLMIACGLALRSFD